MSTKTGGNPSVLAVTFLGIPRKSTIVLKARFHS